MNMPEIGTTYSIDGIHVVISGLLGDAVVLTALPQKGYDLTALRREGFVYITFPESTGIRGRLHMFFPCQRWARWQEKGIILPLTQEEREAARQGATLPSNGAEEEAPF